MQFGQKPVTRPHQLCWDDWEMGTAIYLMHKMQSSGCPYHASAATDYVTFSTYITYVARAESHTTSSTRFYKGAHRGVISYKSPLDKETSEGWTVTSSRESHCMGEIQHYVLLTMYYLSKVR